MSRNPRGARLGLTLSGSETSQHKAPTYSGRWFRRRQGISRAPTILNNQPATMSSHRKKLLLMGRSGSGKSSMRSIIFSNYSAFDTRRLGATIDVEHSHVRFLGHMTLNLWDCGGQDIFVENYFSTQRDHIFRMVAVLIYVFDVESKEVPKDIETFTQCLKNLKEFSPDAKVFALVHKMDLLQDQKRELVFENTMDRLKQAGKTYGMHNLHGFATSIWDESLYQAWSSIVCALIPNMNTFQKHLQNFSDISEAQEVVLFERTTFLVISHVTETPQNALDRKRFEKISNIIKTFKQSCSKMRSQFQTVSLNGRFCSAYIDTLTANTFIMVVMPPKRHNAEYISGDIDGNTIIANIRASRDWFAQIELDEGV